MVFQQQRRGCVGVQLPVSSRGFRDLWSHSFGRVFAETLEDYAHATGFTNHTQYIEMSGGVSGAPDALWEDDGHRENIKAYLDTGEIDVFVMILYDAILMLF